MPTCSSPATLLDQDCGTVSDQAWTWQWWHRGQVLTSSCPDCHQTRAWHQGSPGWQAGTSHVVGCCLHLQMEIYGIFIYKKLCNLGIYKIFNYLGRFRFRKASKICGNFPQGGGLKPIYTFLRRVFWHCHNIFSRESDSRITNVHFS